MKKLKLLLIVIFMFATLFGIQMNVNAAETMNLNITDMRPYTNSKYMVETPNGNDNLIFKIIKNAGTEYVYEDALYCLRSGLGFGNSSTSNSLNSNNRLDRDVPYTYAYNLKSQATDVIGYYRNIGYSIENENYNSILWIADNMYLPEHKDAEKMKAFLLSKAGITNSVLTDDDIEFVQQMALWYFTNYDEKEKGEGGSLSLPDTYVLSNATKVNDKSFSDASVEDGETRSQQIDTLYRYFIDTAKANASSYGTEGTRDFEYVKPEVIIDSSNKQVSESDNFTVVGPFSITEKTGNIGYNLEFIVSDNNGIRIPESMEGTSVVFVTEKPEDMVPYKNSIKETIGQGEFYLKISNVWGLEFDFTNINLEADIEYEKIYNTEATLWLAGENEQPVLKVEKSEILEGNFDILINKVDEKGTKLTGALFSGETKERSPLVFTNIGDGEFSSTNIKILEKGQEFAYKITETVSPSGYVGLKTPFNIKITTKVNEDNTAYILDKVTFIDDEGKELTSIEGVTFEIENNTIVITVVNEKVKVFDLALRKYVTNVNGEVITARTPDINTEKLNNGSTTSEYLHKKLPVEVKKDDVVGYTISVYNEGDVAGKVTKIIDYIPEGISFYIPDSTYNTKFIEYKEEYADGELEGKEYIYKFNEQTRALEIFLREPIELDPYNGENLDSESIEIYFEVDTVAESQDIVLTNIATMEYAPLDEKYKELSDRDSGANVLIIPEDLSSYKGDNGNKAYLGDLRYFYKGQQDDDDFEKLVIKGVPFDLSLRKFITKVNGVEVDSRIPEIDTSKLNTINETTGDKITTAKYTHSKEPVVVKQGDIVTYKIRVYNEGDLDGYATAIVDYLPEGLGYLMNYKGNTDNGWIVETDETTTVISLVGTDGVYASEEAIKNLKSEDFYNIEDLSDVQILKGSAKVTTDALEDEKIKAYNPELTSEDISEEDNWQQSENGEDGLYYRDVEVTCIVLAKNTFKDSIRNIAEIKEDEAVNAQGETQDVTDRDSHLENVNKDIYNPPADNSSYQEDDDDYELIELRYFDLALRKFITKVNEEEITSRIPEVKIGEDGNLDYDHSKEPVYVSNSDFVTYTLRVYNEGTVSGTPVEVSDDIPNGLVFIPEHETNKNYEWKMYDKDGKETEDPLLAVEIRTKYLDEVVLNPYDATKEISDQNPDYAEVKAVFQVLEENITAEDRIITNKAQITEDKAYDEQGNEVDLKDEDSVPDKWNEGEDDQDIEKVYVRKFDLALLKWVTKTIVTVDGTTTTTDTGFTPYDDPEPIAKVVIDKKKLNKTSVKFAYNIIITNQGEIEGYATEITDYIPEGLEFVQEDNPIWTKEGDNKITTRALENTLLKPGETATIEVIFTWKKDANNLGTKTNIAEISEDYNEKGSKDVDSTPDNVVIEDYDKQQEDDDDKALVILELRTGGNGTSYLWLGLVVLLILSSGIILIKKYVM